MARKPGVNQEVRRQQGGGRRPGCGQEVPGRQLKRQLETRRSGGSGVGQEVSRLGSSQEEARS